MQVIQSAQLASVNKQFVNLWLYPANRVSPTSLATTAWRCGGGPWRFPSCSGASIELEHSVRVMHSHES